MKYYVFQFDKIKKFENLIMTENDILGFDPTSLTAFNQQDQKSTSQGNSLIYKTSPKDSKSEDGHYYATIKIVYNPFNPKQSTLDQQSYALNDSQGWFTVVSSLTNNDTSCPIFKAWKKCHYTKKEDNFKLWAQAAPEKDGGKGLFDKRYTRYCVVQVLSDKNKPELEGKFLFWKMPLDVYNLIQNRMNPSKESGKAPIPVMDYLFGRALDIEVVPGPGRPGDERYARETKYMVQLSENVVSCVNPDGSPLLNDEEQEILDKYVFAMTKVWQEKDPAKREVMKAEIDANENTVALRKFYNEKIFPQIKSWCPNLIEQLGYKPWSPEVTARVQHWIDIVLAGNDPKTIDAAPAAAATVGTTSATTVTTNVASTTTVDSVPDAQANDTMFSAGASEDLPF